MTEKTLEFHCKPEIGRHGQCYGKVLVRYIYGACRGKVVKCECECHERK